MVTPDISLILIKEMHRDMLREVEKRRLFAQAGIQPLITIHTARHSVAWLGKQMVTLGAKLQSFDAPTATDNLAIKKA